MKKIAIFIMASLLGASALAEGVSVGGVVAKQSGLYRGSEDTAYLPYISFEYKNFYMDSSELGFKLINTDDLSLSVYGNLWDGHAIKASNMDYGYKTIKERKNQITGGLKLELPLNVVGEKFDLSTSIESGRRGAHGELSIAKSIMLGNNFVIAPSINSKYFSKDYTRYYFGIEGDELGGAITQKYRPDNSYTVGAGLYAEYYFNRVFSMFGFASVDRYSREVRKSPIVKNDIVTNVGVGLKFSF